MLNQNSDISLGDYSKRYALIIKLFSTLMNKILFRCCNTPLALILIRDSERISFIENKLIILLLNRQNNSCNKSKGEIEG